MATREEVFTSAMTALADGRPDAAAKQLRTFLSVHSRDVDARYHYARCLAAANQLEQAVIEFQRLLAVQTQHLGAWVDMGIALNSLGRPRDALAALERAKALDSRHPVMHFAFGLCQLGSGDLPAAEASLRLAIASNLKIPEAYDQLGAALLGMRRYKEAINSFQQALALNPRFGPALINLGDAQMRVPDAAAAIDAYRRAAALMPDDPRVDAALGAALLTAGDALGAATSLERALDGDGQRADVAMNLAAAYKMLHRRGEATTAYERALAIDPHHADALLGFGLLQAESGESDRAEQLLLAAYEQRPGDVQMGLRIAEALENLGRRAQAVRLFERITEACPADPDVHDSRGRLLQRLGRHEAALECYSRALEVDPARSSTRLNRARALETLGRIREAIDEFRAVLAAAPGDPAAVAGLASCGFRICDWELSETMTAQLLATPTGIDEIHPFLRFAMELDPAVLADASRRTAGKVVRRVSHAPIAPYAHDRLRVAYISPDFRQHAVAHALAGVIHRHDRRRIEAIGVATTASDNSDIANRLRSSFEEFLECGTKSDGEMVELLRSREIDVAVDLAGYTAGGRPEIFASRVAPVQINYLGFAGSTGAPYMDYIIADETVIRPREEFSYAERVVRLPHCYLPFDSTRSVPGDTMRRGEVGLPDDGFVFCGFSAPYKINRKVFATWLRLLEAVPRSVLWLRGGSRDLENVLVSASRSAGISADRLVFASFAANMDEYMARLRLADLFLDTAPYNAHTTGAEALWAGVPMVTCRGNAFAGRVGESLLRAAALPDLICDDLDAYFARAQGLASSPQELAALRAKVVESGRTSPLFDSARYVRDFDAALLAISR
jgi:protein O-GlcNAc transferase